jgi:tripartite-type tricarboxylate transporter receptor subunit TctC
VKKVGSMVLFVLLCCGSAIAQDFPSKPIKMVVPYAPGGGTDVLARLIGQAMTAQMSQPVVVENRPGGGGIIGTDLVIKAPADGYTLLFNNETLVVAPGITKSLPYDAARDLAPIGRVANSVIVIGVHPSIAADSLQQLVALVRAAPDKFAYSSCGKGTIMHLAGEQLKLAAGLSMTHVPYRGCAPALQDTLSGHVPVFINALTNAVSLEKEGRVRILAVASIHRSKLAPQIPTVAEQGFANFDATPFQALYGPPGMPSEILKVLSVALKQAVESTDQRIKAMSFEPAPSSPAELGELVRIEIARWSALAQTAKIEAE